MVVVAVRVRSGIKATLVCKRNESEAETERFADDGLRFWDEREEEEEILRNLSAVPLFFPLSNPSQHLFLGE